MFFNEMVKTYEVYIMNKKRKKAMLGLIIGILFIGISIAIVCVINSKETHKYLAYEELEPSQIVFLKEDVNERMVGWSGYFWAYDINGSEYKIEFNVDEYGQIEELRNSIINGDIENNKYVELEAVENYVDSSKVEEMYEKLLHINRWAKYKKVSQIVVLDSGTTRFYGVRFQQNGEAEYVMIWSDSDSSGKDMLDDSYAIEICNWMIRL